MNYDDYIRKYPDDILVCIEEINRANQTVVFDFLDRTENLKFLRALGLIDSDNQATMILLKNYKLKAIRENTVYSIDPLFLEEVKNSIIIEGQQDSYLFGYNIILNSSIITFFKSSVSLSKLDFPYFNYNQNDFKYFDDLAAEKISVIIRNVGQGSWNEILIKDEVKIVFDIGAAVNASKQAVKTLTGNRCSQYEKSNPGLFLSHWDKDHYHALLGMSDKELEVFSFFVCRDVRPNITSITLFDRLNKILGANKVFAIPNIVKPTLKYPTKLELLYSNSSGQFLVFNSMENKDRNQAGIVLAIRTRNSGIVLSGDIHFYQLSDYVLQHFNYMHNHYLIVPHHGGKAGKYIYNLNTKRKEAIISVGNSYGHPLPYYVTALSRDFDKLSSTRFAFKDIIVVL